MVSPSVLGAATGVGLALLIALSAVIYRYYSRNRKEMMIVFPPPRRPSQDRRQKRLLHMREASATLAFPPQQQFSRVMFSLQNFSIFREQPQRTHPSPAFLSSSCPTQSSGMAARGVSPVTHSSACQDHVYVRLSLPDVHVDDEKVSASQSSYSLPAVRKRSPVNRARSMDARAMPSPVPRLSICTRCDSGGGPASPSFLRTPSPEGGDPILRPVSPTGGIRPRSLSPLLSPAYSQNSQSSRDSRDSDCGPSPGSASPLGSIQPDLYKKKDMVFFHQSTESQDGSKYGRLHFRLKYDFDRSDLVVHVIEALDLGTLSANGFNDPYVQVSLLPEVDSKVRRTDIRRNCPDPFFNEIFKFPVSYEELVEKTLLFQVFDYDRFSRNDVTGEVRLSMCELDITSELEVWSEIHKSGRVSQDRPEILLSLSYLPSAGRLTLVVLKASNLVSSDNKDYPDAYVKVSLTSGDNKKIKKKKTTTKKGANNPVWNEAISFDVTEDDLKHCHLVVSVVNCHHGHSPLLGTCVLGHRGHGQGSVHWDNMIQNPRKSMAMWHPLYI
ncbi:synaptotagmin-6-like [Uloborus diversus]|uniref:synaptotagmin-6-like n=1 Tax=Uloborus diversus TaxID=327109 RepID=UPI00240A0120|nr:synaptotagmin-6-like [Uloborus diversus]